MAFCNLLRLVVGKPERLGSVIPLTLLCMLILCPVFIDVNGFGAIQYLLPAYYYLKGLHSDFYLYGMFVYSVVLIAISILTLSLCKNKNWLLNCTKNSVNT
jgi:hypothetical protein